MALTESNMLPLGTPAPEFFLPDVVSGRNFTLKDLSSSKATLLMFICNHCPYVVHVQEEIVRLAKDYQAKGVSVIAISSNDAVQYPEDAPDKMKVFAETLGFTFPYLYDETQQVAKLYDAACTPDFYVFDNAMQLAYRGRLDGSRPKNDIPLTGNDLRAALDTILAGEKIAAESQRPSAGCNIKWKKPD